MDNPIPEAVVTQFCDKMLTAAIGKDWRQRAPEAVTAFWMGEVRVALQEALSQLSAAQQQEQAAEARGVVDEDFLLELRQYFQDINLDDNGDDYMNSSDEAIRLIDSKLEAMRYCAALATQRQEPNDVDRQ
jgi:hypothetical protein